MKGKAFFYMILLLSSIQSIYSQQATVSEAELVAVNGLYYATGVRATVTNVFTYTDNVGNTLLYEVCTSAGINMIVSGNKCCEPILARYQAYAPGAVFDRYDSLPCGMRIMLDNYKNMVSYYNEKYDASSPHIERWQQLKDKINIYANKAIGSVDPLLTTKWGQSVSNSGGDANAYNYYAPSGGGCNHGKAGCVAVAMAQVMNYWKYPTVIPDNWQFDWCYMADGLYTSSPNYEKERNAVARLIERCGRRAQTDYGCSVSKSNIFKAKKAFDKFGYNSSSDHSWRLFNHATWESDLRNELSNGRPVVYGASGIYDSEGLFPGHAFVCDGYSSDGKFHFNWA